MVGFNRRFAPLTVELKKHLDKLATAKTFVFTVNAGAIPKKHWTQDLEVGGGRLVGEGCHFIDLLRFLSGSSIKDAQLMNMRSETNDTFSISLSFANGDLGVIHYLSNGNKEFPKERLEVFVAGKIMTLNNFKSLNGIGLKKFKYMLGSQDKGHSSEVENFANAIKEGKQSISLEELFEVSEWSIKLQNKLNSLSNV
jgi:predicted dehydrogenase